MKHIKLRHVISLFICSLFLGLSLNSQSAITNPPVKVQGRQLMIDVSGTGSGVYQPYTVRGVGYSPIPIGRVPEWGWNPPNSQGIDNMFNEPQILDRDFPLLQAMHANTIRIWKGNHINPDGNGNYPDEITNLTLTKAAGLGIKVIAGFWIGPVATESCTGGQKTYSIYIDLKNAAVRQEIIDRFKAYVTSFANRPEILFWAIGNENNYSLNPNDPVQIRAWYDLVDQMAREAHAIEDLNGGWHHPVAVVNGDLQYIGDASLHADDSNAVDIWGANVYRGASFGDLFYQYKNKSTKPLWIAEYGGDAWHVNNFTGSPGNGFEDQASQAAKGGGLWDEIAGNSDITIGGTIMAYSDEWWKPYQWRCTCNPATTACDLPSTNCDDNPELCTALKCNSNHYHAGTPPLDKSCPADGVPDFYPPEPDNYWNESWWGIMSISKAAGVTAPNIMTKRQIYNTLAQKFNPAVAHPLPAYMMFPINGSTLNSTQTFGWSKGQNVTQYRLDIGTTAGGTNIYSASQGTNTSVAVAIPITTGQTIYVRLRSLISGAWQNKSYQYKSMDQVLPTGSILINNGAAATNNRTVTLNLSAADSGSGMGPGAQMSLSNNGSTWNAPEPYVTQKSWLLTALNGTKRVYVKFKDAAGNWSTVYSDTIKFDTAVPTGTIQINNGAATTTSVNVTLNLTATDALSGMGAGAKMQFRNAGGSWQPEEAYAPAKAWVLTAAKGTKTVYVRFRDVAGNLSDVFSDTITLM